MKKIMLLMLLCLSSLILSQNTNTKNIEIPESQLKEIYKGLKQGEYLKVRLDKTEKALKDASDLITEQKSALENSSTLVKAKDQMLKNNEEMFSQEKTIYDSRISILQADYKILQETSKADARRKMWNGIKIGGVSVAILGVGAFLLINK
ncbi:MAG: hypothetical protein RSE50_00895 [Myroides sp.]